MQLSITNVYNRFGINSKNLIFHSFRLKSPKFPQLGIHYYDISYDNVRLLQTENDRIQPNYSLNILVQI